LTNLREVFNYHASPGVLEEVYTMTLFKPSVYYPVMSRGFLDGKFVDEVLQLVTVERREVRNRFKLWVVFF
jgi:hypothetical protein